MIYIAWFVAAVFLGLFVWQVYRAWHLEQIVEDMNPTVDYWMLKAESLTRQLDELEARAKADRALLIRINTSGVTEADWRELNLRIKELTGS